MAVKWMDLHKYSLIRVEFGNNKNSFDSDDESTYRYGINLGHEFCYRHMAIVISNDVRADEIVVAPLTSYKYGDEKYPSNLIIDTDKYGYMVQNKTTIKTNHIRSIDKKKRVKQIIKPYISKTLKLKLNEAIRNNFE